MKPSIVGCWIAFAAVLAGCGGGSAAPEDAPGDGGTITTIDGSAKLSNLSSSQAAQLCTDLSNFMSTTLVPDACRSQGYSAAFAEATANPGESDADLRAACSAAYDQCGGLRDGGAVHSDADATGGACAGLSSPTCTATVAELTSCLADLNQAYQSVPNCDVISRTSLTVDAAPTGMNGAVLIPNTCVVFNADCRGTGLIQLGDAGQ